MRLALGWMAALVLLAGCSEKAPPEPLAYVPADTPYVIGNRLRTPEAVSEAWLKFGMTDQARQDLERFRSAMEQVNPEGESAEAQAFRSAMLRWTPALIPEIERMQTMAGIDELGFAREGLYAIYGHGLLPVMRAELSSVERFAATVARVEQAAGEALPVRRIGSERFWQLSMGKVELLFGTPGGHLVLTLGPSAQDEAAWRRQLGLELPSRSLKDSDGLAVLDREQGYSGNGSGWIDLRAMLQRLTGQHAADKAVMAAFGLPVPEPTPGCLAEYESLVARMPRIVAGATRLDAREMVLVSHLELDATWRDAMMSLPAPMPGPGVSGEGLLRFGLSVDAMALMRQLGTLARTIQATPFACETLAPLNQLAAQLDQGLKSPALGMAGAVSAAQLVLDAVQLGEDGMPEQLDGVLALGASMPPMLWSLAQQGLPALGAVSLSADGKPVELPAELLPLPLRLQALMTDKSLGVAIGAVDEARFRAEAAVPAKAEGTFVYYALRGAALSQLAALIRDYATEEEDGLDDEDLEADDAESTESSGDREAAAAREAEEVRQAAELISKMGEQLEVMQVTLGVDARGLRSEQRIRLN